MFRFNCRGKLTRTLFLGAALLLTVELAWLSLPAREHNITEMNVDEGDVEIWPYPTRWSNGLDDDIKEMKEEKPVTVGEVIWPFPKSGFDEEIEELKRQEMVTKKTTGHTKQMNVHKLATKAPVGPIHVMKKNESMSKNAAGHIQVTKKNGLVTKKPAGNVHVTKRNELVTKKPTSHVHVIKKDELVSKTPVGHTKQMNEHNLVTKAPAGHIQVTKKDEVVNKNPAGHFNKTNENKLESKNSAVHEHVGFKEGKTTTHPTGKERETPTPEEELRFLKKLPASGDSGVAAKHTTSRAVVTERESQPKETLRDEEEIDYHEMRTEKPEQKTPPITNTSASTHKGFLW